MSWHSRTGVRTWTNNRARLAIQCIMKKLYNIWSTYTVSSEQRHVLNNYTWQQFVSGQWSVAIRADLSQAQWYRSQTMGVRLRYTWMLTIRIDFVVRLVYVVTKQRARTVATRNIFSSTVTVIKPVKYNLFYSKATVCIV